MYRAILLDLGKVLIDFDFSAGYRALEELCPYPEAEIRRRIAATDLAARYESGLIESRDFCAQLCALLELQVDYDRFCAIWNSIFSGVLLPESMIEGLARRYRLVVVSNTNQIRFTWSVTQTRNIGWRAFFSRSMMRLGASSRKMALAVGQQMNVGGSRQSLAQPLAHVLLQEAQHAADLLQRKPLRRNSAITEISTTSSAM
jgi:hypothetical protein